MRENLFSLKRQEQDLSGEHMDLAMQYQTGSISELAYQAANAKTPEFRFSTEIPTMQAVSQGNTGRCWILAGLNLLREIAVRKMERESLPEGNFLFSPGYLAFWDKLEKADCFLEKAIQLGKLPYDNREVCSWFSYAITEGGFWNYFTDLVRKYGLVPYEKMPETAHSADTEEVNHCLNYYIRKIGADLRNAQAAGKSQEELSGIKARAMDRIFSFLCKCYGCPPKGFSYAYTKADGQKQAGEYTPVSFFRELTGDFLEELTPVISLPYEKLPFYEPCALRKVFQVAGTGQERFLNLPMEELKACCIRQLKEGVPVVCTGDDDKMCQEELQLWDDLSFDYEAVTGFSFEMSRRDYFQLKGGTACHSMLLTGVLEENGRPVHWKIENSYGIFGLHRGYYICSDSWFEKYMLSAVILKKYLKKYGKAWERAPHLFDIWEIM